MPIQNWARVGCKVLAVQNWSGVVKKEKEKKELRYDLFKRMVGEGG